MRVICTGMPKTGTKSLCSALRILGYKVYDFEEQYWFIGSELKSILNNGCTNIEIKKVLKGVDAITDMAACFIWEFIFKAFPDVKVIHTERNTDEEWINSFLNQLHGKSRFQMQMLLMFSYTGFKFRSYINASWRVGCGAEPVNQWGFQKQFINTDVMKLKYRQHNAYVKQTVPEDQLLLFKLSEGWEPLCKFLDVPIPDQDFPHRNKGGEYVNELIHKTKLFKQVKKECIITLGLITITLALILSKCYALIFVS